MIPGRDDKSKPKRKIKCPGGRARLPLTFFCESLQRSSAPELRGMEGIPRARPRIIAFCQAFFTSQRRFLHRGGCRRLALHAEHYLLHLGLRFSMKAPTPSAASSPSMFLVIAALAIR